MKKARKATCPVPSTDTVETLTRDIFHHITLSLGCDADRAAPSKVFRALALAVRDRLVPRWIATQRSYYARKSKRVYYLSLEYLPGRLLLNCLHNIGLYETARDAVAAMGHDVEQLAELEYDQGLGNGGLGRLASCYLDSMATLDIPAYGYGIRYDYGIFYQVFENGEQVERCDNWLREGNVWEFERQEHLYLVRFGGHVRSYRDAMGRERFEWADTDNVMAMACDTMLPGYRNDRVINMRLWAAKSSREFNLQYFNRGDYIGAVEERMRSENISRVLYPSDEAEAGRELRLKQQYFFVAATIQDILRRFRKSHASFDTLPDEVAIHLNETHPAIAVPEMMRLLLDEEGLPWEEAWSICQRTFAYTNHTVMPEALEVWPVDLIGRVLPRHLQIIYEINRRFLEEVGARFPCDIDRLRRMSLIAEAPTRLVRMAYLAVVGSHSVNGVSALHSDILKRDIFRDFVDLYPERFNNKTNGITPRRWLQQCNLPLSSLITEAVGGDWPSHLEKLEGLKPLSKDAAFRKKWREAREKNKTRFAEYVSRKVGVHIEQESLIDVQVKRIHEYKRQLLKLLHVVTLYERIKSRSGHDVTPRTVVFAGKAAPGYYMAKRTIALINAVAAKVNADLEVDGKLKVVFLPNYCVSQSEKIVPAADLSEQISTAGTEASGTGNMKLSLNGALTIGTLDGANIEIRDAVGHENFFVFGHDEEGLAALRRNGYNPWERYESDRELKHAVDMIARGEFSGGDGGAFSAITDALLRHGDRFFVLADFRSYIDTQDRVAALFGDSEKWTRMSIQNTAGMGRFSSDRAIAEYSSEIWKV